MQSLQQECDIQAKKIVESFVRNREFDSRSQQVQQSLRGYKSSNPNEKYDILEVPFYLVLKLGS